MIEQPHDNAVSDSPDERDPLDMVAEEFAERCRRGEQPSLSDYLTRYPQWADELRELLPAAAMMEELRLHKRGAHAITERETIERLADYRCELAETLTRGDPRAPAAETENRLRRALTLLQESADDPAASGRFTALAGRLHSQLAPILEQQNRKDEAETSYRQALMRMKSLDRHALRAAWTLLELGHMREGLVHLILERGRPAEARVLADEWFADLQKLPKHGPFGHGNSSPLRAQYTSLAGIYRRLKDAARTAEVEKAASKIRSGPPPRRGPDKKSPPA